MLVWALSASTAGLLVLYLRERSAHQRCAGTLLGEQEANAQLIQKNAALEDELADLRVSAMRKLN
jgi:hypothetical protein